MLFNSLHFLIFFPVVTALYFLLPLIATFEFSLRMKRDAYTFEAYRVVFSDARFQATFGYSVIVAIATIVVCALLVVPTAYWVQLRMPRLRGQTLAARLARGPLSLAAARRLFASLASAVEALHQAGLVHRDIKPENVFVDESDEHAVLLDLGIAREEAGGPATTTREGRVRGTPAYMAPERFFGARASRSSDIYELAVVFFAMLTGALPWDDPTDAAGRLVPRSPAERGCKRILTSNAPSAAEPRQARTTPRSRFHGAAGTAAASKASVTCVPRESASGTSSVA